MIFPETKDLSFDNPIVGLRQGNGSWFGYNFCLKNGVESNNEHWLTAKHIQQIMIQDVSKIRSVTIYQHEKDGELCTIEFYDEMGNLLMTPGDSAPYGTKKEIHLDEGERLIGVLAHHHDR